LLTIFPIPAFNDNYIWCLHDSEGETSVVVDPGQSAPVVSALQRKGLELSGILITHHHADHIGGVRELLELWPDIPVYGPADPRIVSVNHSVDEGGSVDLPDIGVCLNVLSVPGHTSTHIAYFGEGKLFCGDTLFAGGCGRVFDGTHEQLAASLSRIADLPRDTEIYCAHEYTQDNLGFARWVEPGSEVIVTREAEVKAQRAKGQGTVPSLLRTELATNPFMRVQERQVIDAAEKYAGRSLASSVEVFTAIRRWKDREYD